MSLLKFLGMMGSPFDERRQDGPQALAERGEQVFDPLTMPGARCLAYLGGEARSSCQLNGAPSDICSAPSDSPIVSGAPPPLVPFGKSGRLFGRPMPGHQFVGGFLRPPVDLDFGAF